MIANQIPARSNGLVAVGRFESGGPGRIVRANATVRRQRSRSPWIKQPGRPEAEAKDH
jgi:hypothetical protein